VRNTNVTDAEPGQPRNNVRVQFDLFSCGLQDAPRGDAVVASCRPLDGRQREKSKEQEMKRSLTMGCVPVEEISTCRSDRAPTEEGKL
jgi:hypothetical protein